MIKIRHKGDFSATTKYLQKAKRGISLNSLDKFGKAGVAALMSATPTESGKTAASWYYEIERSRNGAAIRFYNSHENKGVNIAIILQYGHGTGTGGWVEGREYINSAIQPIFDQMANEAWREVTTL